MNHREGVARASRAVVAVTWFWLGVFSCRSSVEPLPKTYPVVSLESIWVEASWQGPLFWDSGVLIVMGEPTDSALRLGDRERLRVVVTSTRGESETLEFWRHVCDGFRICTDLSILMDEGRNVREVESLLAQVPARFQQVAYSGSFGGARVFEPDRVGAAMAVLRSRGGVKSVDRSVIGGTSAPPLWLVLASAPVDAAQPVPHDGIVQALQGDTIRVKYTQPSGAFLEYALAVP